VHGRKSILGFGVARGEFGKLVSERVGRGLMSGALLAWMHIFKNIPEIF